MLVRDVGFDKKDGTPLVSLTLLNSRLQSSKQTGLTNELEFHLLGGIDTKPTKPLGSIENRLATLGVCPYANTLPSSIGQPNPEAKFNFAKLRDFQNLQWSQDALS